MRVAIVTDSSANIPEDLMYGLDIYVVPQFVVFGEDSYLDGVEIDKRAFYEKMAHASELPTTSQPNAGMFAEMFARLLTQGYDKIVATCISGKLSGAMRAAETAAQLVGGGNITCVESSTTEFALGIQVLEAARLAAQGATVPEIVARMMVVRDHTRAFIVLHGLDHLRRGGRIGGAAAVVGSLLQIKPIIYLNEGRVDVFRKVRTSKAAFDLVLSTMFAEAEQRAIYDLAVIHSAAEDLGLALSNRIRERLPDQAIRVLQIDPIVGVHTGPGAVGLIYRIDVHGASASSKTV